MSQDPDDSADINSEDPPRYETNPFSRQQRQQPSFGGFDDDNDAYEEPDRDTDYASAYGEESFDDEIEALPDLDSVEDDHREGDPMEDALLDSDDDGDTQPTAYAEEFEDYPPSYDQDDSESYEEEDEGELDDRDDELDAEDFSAPAALFSSGGSAALDYNDETIDDRWQEPAGSESDDTDEWDDEEDYQEVSVAHNSSGQPWPLGLIAVAVVAVLLLTAGGYGVMQQRSATQDEIRQLRAALATAASPEDVSEIRIALQGAKQSNAGMAAQLNTLQLENRRLSDTVNGLEAQQAAIAKKTADAASLKKATPKPAPKASKPTAAAATTGSWFVNFGSYGQSEIAQQWVHKLKPVSGKVITAPSVRDGRTFYRVRVINLSSRDAAERVAIGLEREYGLPKLWIGQQK